MFALLIKIHGLKASELPNKLVNSFAFGSLGRSTLHARYHWRYVL